MSEDIEKVDDWQDTAASGTQQPAPASGSSIEPDGSGELGHVPPAQVDAALSDASSINAAKPVATTAQLADYLLNGYWLYDGESAHRWASNTITYNINGLTAAEKILAQSALNAWHEVANLNFVLTTGVANITYTHNGTMTASESDLVNGSGFITSAYINISADWITNDGGAYDGKTGIDSYGYQTYIHETGHALGLGHQGPYNGSASYSTGATYANDTWQYSVMSYFSQPNYDGSSYRYVITPQMADIYAVQAVYGAAATRTGDTVYGFNNTAGSIYNFSSYAPAPALTIYDSGGSDTLDASGYAVAQIINLRPGSFSSIGGLSHNIGIATTTVIETGIGGSGSDALYAGDTGNTLKGGGARDYLYGGNGVDRLFGGSGSDIMSGGAAADIFVFAAGDSSATTGQHDIITDFTAGLDQFDLTGIDGDTGTSGIMDAFRFLAASAFDGGAAALNYFYDSVRGFTVLQGDVNGDLSADFAIDLTGNLSLTTANFTSGSLRIVQLNLTGTAGTDTLNGDWLGDTLYGLAGTDTLRGYSGADLLDGGADADIMIGGAGDDTYYVDNAGDQVVELVNEGSDTVYATTHVWMAANVETLILQGTADLQGTGNALNNTLYGNAGGNILSGEAGTDTLYGGAGNDTYYVQEVGDQVVENAGEGTDYVYVLGNFNYTLSANVEVLLLQGAANLQGTGNSLDNALYGNTGANILIGGDGNDALYGGAGADIMYGGTGGDAYFVDDVGDQVIENVGEGGDAVYAMINYQLGANVDHLYLQGTANLQGTGNALSNAMFGNSGANVLNGAAGADMMFGGAGNDTYYVDDVGDQVTEDPGAGIDKVYASVTYTLTANVENLTLTGSAAVNATGNALDNVITGNSGNNALVGGGGTDTAVFSGNWSNYLISFDAGTNTFTIADQRGGVSDGTDTATEIELFQFASGALSASALYNRAPTDVALSGGSIAENSANGAVVGTVTGVDPDAGTTFSYALTGNAGGRFAINATTGQLTVANGALLDYETATSHAIGVRVTDQGGLTFDKALNVAVTNVSGAFVGQNGVNDTLTGTDEEDTLSGLSGIDTLWGLGGNDSLDGGIGADVMRGGVGNDVYFVDDAGDQAIENAGEGIDAVYFNGTVLHQLGANIENLYLQGMADLAGYGNGLNNTIYGNSGNNALYGGVGADIMYGGTGGDAYFVDDIGDQVIEYVGEGGDAVYATISYQLGANVDHLYLQGTADLQGTGNELSNAMFGNSGNNILVGAGGSDYVSGGAGNDTLTGAAGNDSLFGGDGTDTAVYAGSRSDYTIAYNAGTQTYTVTDQRSGSPDGADSVTGVEYFQFANGTIAASDLFATAPTDIALTGGTVAENAASGTSVATLSATDPDVGETYTFSLVAGATDRFEIAGATIVVKAGAQLNYENSASHALTVRVTDAGGAGYEEAFTINVTNVNEAPGNATLTGGSVAENVANATVVGTVTGVDPDAGGALSYALTGDAGGRFAINATTGQLTVANASLLDYESATSHAITVRVTDQGGLTFDKALSIHVTNVNEAPTNATLTGGSVAENAANGTVVGTVAGVDPDAGTIFGFTLAGNAGGRFAVNATTGQITVANGALLDYETATSHAITVHVTDQGGLSFDKALNIALTNVSGVLTGQNGVNDTLTGTGEEDALSGLSGVDTLWGLAGNDSLDGGIGADVMRGGIGNDVYYVDDVGDQAIENAGEGNDTVYATTHVWMAANVESLILQGTADLQGTGNALNNTIYGNAGGNILSGEGGADTLYGGAGNDTYYVSEVGDLVIENAGEGIDFVYVLGNFNYTLGANFEVLLLQGAGDLQGTGNNLDNAIYGNAGANILTGADGNDALYGGAGADVLYGGAGSDAYFVDEVGDQVIENVGEGGDAVYATINYQLGANVDHLYLQGAANLQGTGNALSNAMFGNSGNNVLNGAAGDDYLSGGAGNDTFVFNAGFGQDTINDFTAGAGSVDVIEFHDAIFANFAAVQAASHQVGADVKIDVDASNGILLQNVTLASLHQDDFRFI